MDRPDWNIRPFREERDWKWWLCYLPVNLYQDAVGIMALQKGVPRAGVVLHNFYRHSVEIHIVMTNPLCRKYGFGEAVAEQVFGGERIVAHNFIAGDNTKSLRIAEHFGMKETGRVANAHEPGVDYILMSLDKEDCRFYKEK